MRLTCEISVPMTSRTVIGGHDIMRYCWLFEKFERGGYRKSGVDGERWCDGDVLLRNETLMCVFGLREGL